MATFRATFFTVTEDSRPAVAMGGQPLPVADLSSAQRLTNLTTSGTSGLVQSGGSDWTSPGQGVVEIYCTGGVNIAAGSAPTAAETAGSYVPALTLYYVTVAKGDKLAVIDE